VIDIYLDAEIFARRPARFRKETVIPLLMSTTPVKIAPARQVLMISTADLDVAQHFQTHVNAPVAEVRGVLTGRSGASSISARSPIAATSSTSSSTPGLSPPRRTSERRPSADDDRRPADRVR
jgi:hypothetical protein